jgi:hypothetical protein
LRQIRVARRLQVATVIACEPSQRIVFTGSTADWEEGMTEVEVMFQPLAERMRVEVHLSRFERPAALGPDVAAKPRGGWGSVLASFAETATRVR